MGTSAGLAWAYVFANVALTTRNNLWIGVAVEAFTVAAVIASSFLAKKWLGDKNEAVAKVDGLLHVKAV